MIECHLCREGFEREAGSLARCCIKRCNKHYCIECIKHFNPEFDMQMYRKDTWICFSCQEICNCPKCKRQDSASKPKKKQPRPKPQGEQSIELSVSNISPTAAKLEATFSLDPQPEPEIPDIDEAEVFKTHTEEELSQFPPFYRKILERRNQYYNFRIAQRKRKGEEMVSE